MLRGLGVGASLTAVYFLAGSFGLSLASVHPSVSAVWPPTGIGIAALLLGGVRWWPSIALGAFLVNLSNSGHVATSLGIACGNTLESVAAAVLVGRFAGGRAVFDRVRTFSLFVLLGAVASTTISASIGVSCLVWAGSVPSSAFGGVWTTWWLGDAVGAVMFAPLIVLWATDRSGWSRPRAIEGAALVAALVAVTGLVFGPLLFGERHYPLTFLPLPFLIWAGFHFVPRDAATVSLLMGAIAIWSTTGGSGPFAGLSPGDDLLMLQVFLGFITATALIVALVAQESRLANRALLEVRQQLEQRMQERTTNLLEANDQLAAEIGERTETQRELAESEARFRELVESAPDAIVILDDAGRIETVNPQTERFFGYERQELIGMSMEQLLPERLRGQHVLERAAWLASPRVRSLGEGAELYGRRKDDSEFPIEIIWSTLRSRGGETLSATIRDMTRRKRAEKVRLANASLRGQVAELTRRTREIGTLNRMADMLRAAIAPEEAYPLVAPFLEEMFPGNSGALYVLDPARLVLDCVAGWGSAPPDEPHLKPDDCWALRRSQVHCLTEGATGAVCPHLPAPPPPVSLCIPMVAKAETIGMFHLMRPRTAAEMEGGNAVPAEYSEYKQRLAQAAAEQIAGAIANARLHQKLRAEAIRDPLTGLCNRRSLEESLAHELHRASRRQTKVGVLMLDIDHFKRLNDRFGHAAGDLTLREIADLLVRTVRKEDVACRYGGEEFTIVLVECSLPDMQRRAEQIRLGIAGLEISYEGRLLGPITVSIGMAMHPDHGSTVAEMLRVADEALYRAKAGGRNQVAVAGGKAVDAEQGRVGRLDRGR